MIQLHEFFNKYLGKEVDFDHAFGPQCVDVFRKCGEEVYDYPHTGRVDSAKDLFLKWDMLPQEKFYFHRLSPNSTPNYGDYAIWDGCRANKNCGHVAIVVREVEDQLLVFEQDGVNQGKGCQFNLRSKKNLLGYLSPAI